MTFRAVIQDSLSLMGLMPKSEGLSLMVTVGVAGGAVTIGAGVVTVGVAGGAVTIGAGVVAEESDEAGWREPSTEETTDRLPDGMNPRALG
jgi:hypothetical protein